MSAPAEVSTIAPRLIDFIVLNEELAALVEARLPIESHLARLGAELPGKSAELARRIGRRMEAGESLAAAMDAECATMPGAYRAVIVAGVESGRLASALEALVDSASRLDALRRVTGMAMVYPLLVLVIVCLLLGLLISTVVPDFLRLGESPFGPIGWLADSPTALLVITIVAPICVVLGSLAWWYRSSRLGGASAGSFGSLTWLPWVRRVHYWGQVAMFADLLAILVERGLPLERALRLAADAVSDRSLRGAAYGIAERTERGDALPPTRGDGELASHSGLPPLVRLALYHTSNRGLLHASLKQAASVYRDRAIRAAEWHAEYLPMILAVGVGGTLAMGFALFVFWPYVSMLHELSQWNWR